MFNLIWKTIDGFENYQVSNRGNVKNLFSGRLLKPLKRSDYFYIVLYKDGKRFNRTIHRLVLEIFHPIKNIEMFVAHHRDKNKLNNELYNLEWENKFSHNGTHHKDIYLCDGNPNSKLKKVDIAKIRKLLQNKILTQCQIAGIFNVNQRTVSAIKCGVHWANI